MRRIALSVVTGALVLVLNSRAADEVKSGPRVGELVPGPVQSFNVTGDRAGKFHCLVCQYGLSPSVLIFAREPPEGEQALGMLLKKLDTLAQKYADYRLGAGVIFVTDGDDEKVKNLENQLVEFAKKEELKQLVMSVINTNSELKEFGPAQEGLKKYAIAPDADLTVLLYRRHKVEHNHMFAKDKLSDKDVDTIVEQAEKMVPRKKK